MRSSFPVAVLYGKAFGDILLESRWVWNRRVRQSKIIFATMQYWQKFEDFENEGKNLHANPHGAEYANQTCWNALKNNGLPFQVFQK